MAGRDIPVSGQSGLGWFEQDNPANMQLTGSNAKEETLQPAASATGTGTVFDLEGQYSTASLQVSGTFIGTVTFEASNDGTNWVGLKSYGISGEAGATTATAPGIFQASVAGIKKVRANITAYTSGNITVIGTAGVVG